MGLMRQTAEGSGKKHKHSALLRPVKLLPAGIKSLHIYVSTSSYL